MELEPFIYLIASYLQYCTVQCQNKKLIINRGKFVKTDLQEREKGGRIRITVQEITLGGR